jgi:hypothetical protein
MVNYTSLSLRSYSNIVVFFFTLLQMNLRDLHYTPASHPMLVSGLLLSVKLFVSLRLTPPASLHAEARQTGHARNQTCRLISSGFTIAMREDTSLNASKPISSKANDHMDYLQALFPHINLHSNWPSSPGGSFGTTRLDSLLFGSLGRTHDSRDGNGGKDNTSRIIQQLKP